MVLAAEGHSRAVWYSFEPVLVYLYRIYIDIDTQFFLDITLSIGIAGVSVHKTLCCGSCTCRTGSHRKRP